MTDRDYGPWTPATTPELVDVFAGARFRWWITGGVALELHTGRSWRAHADADVGICRVDAPALHDLLSDMHPYVAADGRLRPWDGGPLSGAHSENNLWVKREEGGAWWLDVAVGDGDEREWRYRRDPGVRRDWDDAVLHSADAVPYLAPEIQLLFKSKGLRAKDDLDAETVIPLLAPERRRWLRDHLPADHPWLGILARS